MILTNKKKWTLLGDQVHHTTKNLFERYRFLCLNKRQKRKEAVHWIAVVQTNVEGWNSGAAQRRSLDKPSLVFASWWGRQNGGLEDELAKTCAWGRATAASRSFLGQLRGLVIYNQNGHGASYWSEDNSSLHISLKLAQVPVKFRKHETWWIGLVILL